MNIVLKKVNVDNYDEIISLKVAKEQETFIESTKECLDEAKELSLWRPVGVYDEDTLIGFAMYGFFESEGTCGRVWLDRFMIGCKYQGRGYSYTSLKLLIKHISKEYNANEVFLSVYDCNKLAIKIYEKLGFEFNGEVDSKGEKLMVIKLDERKIT